MSYPSPSWANTPATTQLGSYNIGTIGSPDVYRGEVASATSEQVSMLHQHLSRVEANKLQFDANKTQMDLQSGALPATTTHWPHSARSVMAERDSLLTQVNQMVSLPAAACNERGE